MQTRAFLPLGLMAVVFHIMPLCAESDTAKTKSALETDPKGWLNLLDNGIKGWKRIALPLDKKLSPENPWKYDPATQLLSCSKPGAFEMLLHPKPFADGIYHVEWRFHPVKDKDNYNSGIYVRCSADGKVWHQAQVAASKKPPQYGDLFGMTPVGDRLEKFLVHGKGAELVHPPGQWNTYEITSKGKVMSVWINGQDATTWKNCQVPKGRLGVQAEFFVIEFKNMKFKPLK